MIDFCLKKGQGLKALAAHLYQNSLESDPAFPRSDSPLLDRPWGTLETCIH